MNRSFRVFSLGVAGVAVVAGLAPFATSGEKRARDWGVPFEGTPGALNAITDVSGVEVGHSTIIEGSGRLVVGEGPVRTGVTAVLPTGRDYRPVFAAFSSLNGNGEMTGTTWIEESGFLEEPILMTNTHSVGAVYEASIHWRRERGYHDAERATGWASLPVVAETWDGRLNDIHGHHARAANVFEALDGARGGPVAEGNVGGGTGMVCHRFKGGIGTASRVTEAGRTLGVLVQANYGRREDLRIAGEPVGRVITDLMPELKQSAAPVPEGSSIIVIIATDAPLLPHQLERLCKRAPLGIGRVGGYGSNSSGDLFLAFSTARLAATGKPSVRSARMLENAAIDPLLRAAVQAVEEAIVNALAAAETMEGINGNVVHALPFERVMALLEAER